MLSNTPWKILTRLVEIRSPWLTLIGEKLEDNHQQILEYWRVEKADSVIIMTTQNNHFIFPPPSYRPGLGEITLDFPGGRVPDDKTPLEAIGAILKRELGIEEKEIDSLTPMNSKGWAINSSFSNQKLYGFVAIISPEASINPEKLGANYPITEEGITQLLKELTCLQCRGILLEWLRTYSANQGIK
ncbi:hydrolase, NUDIX family, putative [Rippkaea orientalis PCC 8801]|uniref:Hydrolase, NUDIX family, putative n=1 Tax=Rippkaea orientalis (strain PCC 8801 / RF-1) TaxID=41431 RepID=B7K2H0_RIPO1|nr:NUDIX hydrolase [Rippkaea orientalis]ACK66363.1 hydrolase, NUDIX family, putative [Rippkaea orientalis PCC 8801]